jgi:predicted RNA binding protein YcfA (HicA-like mRNA interferase family)
LPKAPVVSGRDMVGILEDLGCTYRGLRGSHVQFKHPETGARISVPVHGNRPLSPGTLHSILKQAGLTVDDLRRLLARR